MTMAAILLTSYANLHHRKPQTHRHRRCISSTALRFARKAKPKTDMEGIYTCCRDDNGNKGQARAGAWVMGQSASAVNSGQFRNSRPGRYRRYL